MWWLWWERPLYEMQEETEAASAGPTAGHGQRRSAGYWPRPDTLPRLWLLCPPG